MGKKKSERKPPKTPAVKFELEPDAEQIFLESLEELPPEALSPKTQEPQPVKAARPRRREAEVDLHRMTLAEAIRAVEAVIDRILIEERGEVSLKVITGKGLHSGPGGAVLPGSVHAHVGQRYASHIVRIDDSPDDVKVGGVPVRGHFVVVLKP